MVRLLIYIMIIYFINKIIGSLFGSNKLANRLKPFIKKWEGGLSKDPSDTAAAYPSPWGGYHTNMGVTYSTFVSLSSELGYEVNKDNFINMPDSIWLKIMKKYMGAYPIEEINHLPSIQAVIFTWTWGSGAAGSEKHLANFQRNYFGIQDSNITKQEIVLNFKERVNIFNEAIVFNALCDDRERQFKSFSTWNVHGKGWLNRLNDFRKLF